MSHANLVITVREWQQRLELATILSPFAQATDVTQGDQVVSIMIVAPCVISLYNHTKAQVETARYLGKLAAALRDPLFRRFEGDFVLAISLTRLTHLTFAILKLYNSTYSN